MTEPALPDLDARIDRHRLGRVRANVHAALAPAIALQLRKSVEAPAPTASWFGGRAFVPADFAWPLRRGRPLDFLVQVALHEAASLDPTGLLPKDGTLAFFYDIENQPWGFDPADLDGFRVHHFPAGTDLRQAAISQPEFAPDPRRLGFARGWTLPFGESRAYAAHFGEDRLDDDEYGRLLALNSELCNLVPAESAPGRHRMFGHPDVVQNDMQLEAQLVTNGLDCGDGSAYRDPRRKVLEAGADDWTLLLQVDSGERCGRHTLDWGDIGFLYFWIRRQDLRARRFDRVWMTLQCC